jgi:CheY-like chemotaxis protein
MGKRILIAEDSSVILNLTKKILEQELYEISAAKNGEEVIRLVEQNNFDLILMDINIPLIDGMECSRQIRSMNDHDKASVPIFAITGNANNYTTEEFKAAGINEYLQKPLNFDTLVTLVSDYTG